MRSCWPAMDFSAKGTGIAGIWLVRAEGVHEHQRVAPVVVLEDEVQPFLFDQAGDELEVGLAVLDAVLALG